MVLLRPSLRLCRNPRKRADVMLSPSAKLRINSAKHLVFSRCYEDEILRLRLRMTLQHSLSREGKKGEGSLAEETRIK